MAIGASYEAEADWRDFEIAKLRTAFLRHIAGENECYAWRHNQAIPCHAEKCGCLCELNNALRGD